jgi:hypothetical protein
MGVVLYRLELVITYHIELEEKGLQHCSRIGIGVADGKIPHVISCTYLTLQRFFSSANDWDQHS